jgi:hypothetical protein
MFLSFGYDYESFYNIVLMLRRFLCNPSKDFEHKRKAFSRIEGGIAAKDLEISFMVTVQIDLAQQFE